MRKTLTQKLALVVALFSTASVAGCSMVGGDSAHKHSYVNKVAKETYLQAPATCEAEARYYYSCECGEKGENTFGYGKKAQHDFSAEIADAKYLKKAGNCIEDAVYFKSCVTCGAKTVSTFTVSCEGAHNFDKEVADGRYLKSEATFTSSAVYYKSCVCGLACEETFTYGDPLRIYTEEEKVPFKPTSLTVSLYDTENSVYGFTYNTMAKPLRPVIQVVKGAIFKAEDCVEYPATVEEMTSFTVEGAPFTYYIVKAEVALEANFAYMYRAYDKYVDVGTQAVMFKAKDLTSNSFTFSHVSDSQDGPTEFGKVLANVANENDFIVHTGDVVENSKFESEWTTMIDGNFNYFSKIPVMAISGNHETTYLNGSNETYKHFHNKMPEQETELGYYYSFTYGNAKFIMLNTNIQGASGFSQEQYDWLVSELEANTAEWTIVAMHYPMYSAGRYGSLPDLKGTSEALRKKLHGTFVEYGVDVVLQGHDHVVSYTNAIGASGVTGTWTLVDGIASLVNPDGVVYTMTGTSGTQTRGPVAEADASLYKYKETSKPSSWTEYTIDGSRLTATIKYADGNSVKTYDTWSIVKSA